jgi:hypothetical protein
VSEDAQLLHRVADGLYSLSDKLPSAPWTSHPLGEGGFEVLASGEWIADVESEDLATWITIWSPGMGRLLTEFLRRLGDDAEMRAADAHAVALAEVVALKLEQ